MMFVAYSGANILGLGLGIQHHISMRIEFLMRARLIENAETLKQLAYKDPLTKTYNRRAFDDDFSGVLKSVKRAGYENKGVFCIMADIDYFKKVNDTYGHDIGDKVIVAFSAYLNETIRPSDRLYRFGGEEFVIILVNCTREVAVRRIESILQHLNGPGLGIAEIGYPVTASFGITPIREDEEPRAVITRADSGLYRAKEAGRNRYEFV